MNIVEITRFTNLENLAAIKAFKNIYFGSFSIFKRNGKNSSSAKPIFF